MKNSVLFRVPESVNDLYERILYPAGELQVRLKPASVQRLFEADSVTVLCRAAHQNLLELALLSDALNRLVPSTDKTLVLPYLPFSRADRVFCEGDCHGLKTFGDIVDSLHFDRVRTLDVHSFRARQCIANLEDISAKPFIEKALADIHQRRGDWPAILLPDEGAKRYDLRGALQCAKHRDGVTGKLTGFTVPVFEHKAALIVDDICDGGGTFLGMAEAIRKDTRKQLYLYVTHGIFSGGLARLQQQFERIYTTDSLPVARLYENELEVFDCEPTVLSV